MIRGGGGTTDIGLVIVIDIVPHCSAGQRHSHTHSHSVLSRDPDSRVLTLSVSHSLYSYHRHRPLWLRSLGLCVLTTSEDWGILRLGDIRGQILGNRLSLITGPCDRGHLALGPSHYYKKIIIVRTAQGQVTAATAWHRGLCTDGVRQAGNLANGVVTVRLYSDYIIL